MKYRVLVDTSVRKSADPKDAAFDEWEDFPAGTTVSRWPAHADVDGWVAAGHWELVEATGGSVTPGGLVRLGEMGPEIFIPAVDGAVIEDDDGNP